MTILVGFIIDNILKRFEQILDEEKAEKDEKERLERIERGEDVNKDKKVKPKDRWRSAVKKVKDNKKIEDIQNMKGAMRKQLKKEEESEYENAQSEQNPDNFYVDINDEESSGESDSDDQEIQIDGGDSEDDSLTQNQSESGEHQKVGIVAQQPDEDLDIL